MSVFCDLIKNMAKENVIIVSVIAVIMIALWGWQSGFFFTRQVEPVPIPEGIVLFYGDGCPHCKIVDDFIEQNNIKDKVGFANLEVWYNKDNQNILAQVVQKCGIPTNEVGVPFLWDGSKCYIGQDEVINFFKNAANIQ